MKKWVATMLAMVYVFALAGCNKGVDTMYQLGIVIDGIFYEKSYQPMPAEVDDSAIVGYIKSYTDTYPKKDGQTNISKDLINAPYAKVEGGIAILYQNEWYLCTPYETETISFHDKTVNKSDLSAETLEWLEQYNELSEKEQLSISYVPSDLLELCGYVATEDAGAEGPTE